MVLAVLVGACVLKPERSHNGDAAAASRISLAVSSKCPEPSQFSSPPLRLSSLSHCHFLVNYCNILLNSCPLFIFDPCRVFSTSSQSGLWKTCTKQGHQKPLDSKDDNTEKHCPVTVNPWHMKKAFKVMNELRSQNLLCDVTIVAEDMEISAHRVVLAACSPYFHAMFTGEMSESRAKRVRIKEVDGWTLRMLIDYVYTAEIQVTEENVQVLLPAAGLLQLQDVKKTCCEFLESQLHPVNCLGIRAFADMHACTDLLNKANTYAEQHFADVVLSEEFLNLGIEQVCSLISSDKLTISSEEKVFEAVIAWVNHDKDVRQEFMARLMEHVRLPLLPREYLVQRVEEEALVKNSSACKDYLIEAMKYHLLPTEQRILMKSVRTRLRTPMNLPKAWSTWLDLFLLLVALMAH
ncbi:kelch-like protein 2 isoform X7 [Homo sapiens]|uniref:kelch-like protein 2 isoform X7 n=1 Tax=Homo sapiens TaxID=9606 RepID=UPI001FB0A8E7|nr:kelch-like protein 2 isoform X7 [Homo sapiens]XP_054204819.1 kelch-like protein 2 isoform X7 [Homo sapiens]